MRRNQDGPVESAPDGDLPTAAYFPSSYGLRLERPRAGVALITIDRVDRLNAMTMDMQRHLDAMLGSLEEDAQTGCVVLTGAGERAFCAGYDVHEMSDWSPDDLYLALAKREQWLWRAASTPVPTIAALNGLTYGVGAIMASSMDIRFGCDETTWRFTAGEHGGANATWSLPSLIGRGLAAELLMTSREVGTEEALRIGLLNSVVTADELLERALDTAEQIAGHPRSGMRAIKRLLRTHVGQGIEQQFMAENVVMRTELLPRPINELYAEFLTRNPSTPDREQSR